MITSAEAVRRLDLIDGRDPEGAHGEADDVLLLVVDAEIAKAYARVVGRCRWWACA